MARVTNVACSVSILSFLAWGCDAQAGTDYRGQSLLTLLGTVEIPEPRAAGQFVPALMFPDGSSSSTYQLVDVAVEGEFPSEFRIDIYKPPPNHVLESVPSLHEPPAAVGWITAVPQDHEQSIRFASTRGTSSSVPACTTPDCSSCEDTASCRSTAQWCAQDGECYREERICPRYVSPDGECTILSSEGDARLKRDPSEVFAGFSQNFVVAYLSGAVGRDSFTAFALGAHEALAAGYHLLAMRRPSDKEMSESFACRDHAAEVAAARTNEARGTDYRPDELGDYFCLDAGECAEGSDCLPEEDLPPQSRLCELSEEERTEIDHLFIRELSEVIFDFRCPSSHQILTHVPDPERERISVRLSADANPLVPQDHL